MAELLAQQANGEWVRIDANDVGGAFVIRLTGVGPPPVSQLIVTLSGLNITTLGGIPLRTLP